MGGACWMLVTCPGRISRLGNDKYISSKETAHKIVGYINKQVKHWAIFDLKLIQVKWLS